MQYGVALLLGQLVATVLLQALLHLGRCQSALGVRVEAMKDIIQRSPLVVLLSGFVALALLCTYLDAGVVRATRYLRVMMRQVDHRGAPQRPRAPQMMDVC